VVACVDAVADALDLCLAVEGVPHGCQASLVATGWVEVAHGHIPVVIHPAEEDFGSVGKAAGKTFRAVMPLAGAKGGVAGFAEALTEQRVLAGNRFTGTFEFVEPPPGVEHGAAGHTDRRNGAAGYVGTEAGGAVGAQAVEVGCGEGRVADGRDRVEALIVGEEQ